MGFARKHKMLKWKTKGLVQLKLSLLLIIKQYTDFSFPLKRVVYTISTNQQGESGKFDPKSNTCTSFSAVIEIQRSGATEQNTG